MDWVRGGKEGLGLESGGLLLWRLPPLTGLDRGTVTGEWEGRPGKKGEEVEEETGSGKCGSRFFSWLRSSPDTRGVTINRETPPKRTGRDGQLLPTDEPMFEGAGSTTERRKKTVSNFNSCRKDKGLPKQNTLRTAKTGLTTWVWLNTKLKKFGRNNPMFQPD